MSRSRKRVVVSLAVDGKHRRRYDHRQRDTDALQGPTPADTRRNVSVAAVVNTLHRLGAKSVTFDGYPTSHQPVRYTWAFACITADGTVHNGHYGTGIIGADQVGIALMHAGAACIRSVLGERTA